MPSYSQQQENPQQEEYILIREWGSKGFSLGQFSQPADVAIESKDNAFLTDITARSNAVQKFNQNGTFISSWGRLGYGQGSFVCASNIATDAQDDVYIVDANNPDQVVQKFTNNGTFITAWGSYGFGDGQFINPIRSSNRFKR